MVVNPRLLRRDDYDKYFLKNIPDGVCPFCEFKKYQIVLLESNHWCWIACIAPYWRWHTMIIPKRHFTDFNNMNFSERNELWEVIDYAMSKYQLAKLKRLDGTEIKKYVYFWRKRFDLFDPISNNVRNDHFHLHLAPDKDHLWDPTLEDSAHEVDISVLK